MGFPPFLLPSRARFAGTGCKVKVMFAPVVLWTAGLQQRLPSAHSLSQAHARIDMALPSLATSPPSRPDKDHPVIA